MKLIRTVAAAATLAALAASPHAAEVKLRILETTDLHMNLLSYDYYQDTPTDQYGLARTVTLIKAARAEAPNSLLFDNGDLLQGTPLGDVVAKVSPLRDGEVHPAYKVMNQLGYDAANLGNHDFNYGLPFLRRSIAGAGFPYVNANVYVDDAKVNAKEAGANAKHAFTPYVLLDRELVDADGKKHPIKVGVIGFVPPQIMQWDKANLEGKVVVRDMAATARRYVPEMRAKGAQLVIAIPHSGFERVIDKSGAGELAENEVGQLSTVPGIDAILFGHSHAEFPGKDFAERPNVDIARGTINGVPAVMPGRWGDHLGVIDFVLDNGSGAWKVTTSRSSIRPIYDRAAKRSLAAADPMVEQAIGAEHAKTLAYIRGKVATTSAPIYSYFAQVADDPSVQIVANAQTAYVKRAVQGTAYEKLPVLSAAAPFKTGGRQGWDYYTDIPAGTMAFRNVADLYVYPNTLKAVLLTGAQVREWIEMSAGQFRRIDPKGAATQPLLDEGFRSYNFDTLDGVTYEFDLTQPARYDGNGKLVAPDAHRVQNLRVGGVPVAADAKFIVATNNYRAFGGGSFPGLDGTNVVVDSPNESRQIVIDYLAQVGGPVNPSADRNWAIRPVPGVAMTFRTGGAATRYLARHPDIKLLQDNGDGSASFELVGMPSQTQAQTSLEAPARPMSALRCPTMVPPQMPVRAKREGIEGEVSAQARIEHGAVTEVTILSGPEVFRDSVAEALRRYRCTDDAAPYVARQNFSFKLEGSGLPLAEDTSLPAFLAGVPDAESIRRANGRVLLRTLFRNPQGVVFGGRTFRSGAMVMELDCQQRRYRNVTTVLHVGLDGDGDAAASTRLDGPIARLGESADERRFVALACEAPLPDAAAAGTAAGRSVRMLAVRPDRRYAALDADELKLVRAPYESLAAGDEPPYPAAGLRSLREALVEAQRSLGAAGTLRLTAEVDVAGNATTVAVAESPSPAMASFATAALMQLRFKPAFCGGHACAMPFPLQVEFPAR